MSGCCDKLIPVVEELTTAVENLTNKVGQNGFEVISVIDGQTQITLAETPNVINMIPILDINGIVPIYGIDYTLTGNQIDWLGFYPLEATDDISITYKF